MKNGQKVIEEYVHMFKITKMMPENLDSSVIANLRYDGEAIFLIGDRFATARDDV